MCVAQTKTKRGQQSQQGKEMNNDARQKGGMGEVKEKGWMQIHRKKSLNNCPAEANIVNAVLL